MNLVEEEYSSKSENVSNFDSNDNSETPSCIFDINEETYEILLRNIITEFEENHQTIVNFNNTKSEKAPIAKADLKFKEVPLYSQTIKVNPKPVFKKASLIYLDDKNFKKENNENMSLDFQFTNHIRDINIVKIFIQNSSFSFFFLDF